MEKLIDEIASLQAKMTEKWHISEPSDVILSDEVLLSFVQANHLMNHKLWHTEDIARRKDVQPEVIADCKYKIDVFNQRRTDFFEKIDAEIVKLLLPKLPEKFDDAQNTESLGMAIDRMSILAHKIYHMKEQTLRTDANEDHIKVSSTKLDTLSEQRSDLIKAIKYLISEYLAGKKRPKQYYQFKMYNDPNFNPQLYGKSK
jgi:cell division protein FtsB